MADADITHAQAPDATVEPVIPKVVHSQHYDPGGFHLFGKSKANDRAFILEIACSCPVPCPLLQVGQCAKISVLGSGTCPYGTSTIQNGPTKRSGKATEWIRQNTTPDVPWLKYPTKRLAFIGDYVYLPYPHMDMCSEAPFMRHSALFVSGSLFIDRADWSIETVGKLVAFRPHALLGGEIASYQKEVVPLFVSHLYLLDHEMWAEVAKSFERFREPPTFIGRKALLSTLRAPFKWTTGNDKYPVCWEWDGQKMTTSSRHAFNSTWGDVKPDAIEISATPPEGYAIEVKNTAWITEQTVFVD